MFHFLYIYIEFDFRQNVFPVDTIILKHFKAHFTNLPNKLKNSEKITKVYAKNALHCQQQKQERFM